MLAGAGLARSWPHDRAHRFFSRARWNPDDLGLAAAKLVVSTAEIVTELRFRATLPLDAGQP